MKTMRLCSSMWEDTPLEWWLQTTNEKVYQLFFHIVWNHRITQRSMVVSLLVGHLIQCHFQPWFLKLGGLFFNMPHTLNYNLLNLAPQCEAMKKCLPRPLLGTPKLATPCVTCSCQFIFLWRATCNEPIGRTFHCGTSARQSQGAESEAMSLSIVQG